MAFVDSMTGWAVGDSGVILKTINGGSTWTVSDLRHVGGAHGRRVRQTPRTAGRSGAGGAILATTNGGGAKWSSQSAGASFSWRLTGVDAVDAAHAWAVAEWGKIVATSNGGGTWTTADLRAARENLTGVSFVDATHGWACGYNGTLLVTASGGVTPPLRTPAATPVITKLTPRPASAAPW